MRHLLLAALLTAAVAPSGAQQKKDDDWVKKLIEAAKAAAAAAPASVDKKPIDALFDKVLKEGRDTDTDAGAAVAVEGIALPLVAGEDLVVGALLTPNPEDQAADGRPGYHDLVYRRTFKRLFAVRKVVTDAGGGFKRQESWAYQLGFEGSLYPVLHTVVVYKVLGGGLSAIDLSRSSSEKLSAQDPAVKKSWADLAPRLLTVTRLISV